MFFRRKPKLHASLDEVLEHIAAASKIMTAYKRDKHFIPTSTELERFYEIEQAFWAHNATLGYVVRCMRQRAAGEPEGAKKFSDPEVFDYHYPN